MVNGLFKSKGSVANYMTGRAFVHTGKASKQFLHRNRTLILVHVPTHVVTLTQVVTDVYLGQTHLGTPFQVSAWVRKFSLWSTRDDHFFGDVKCHQF